MVAHELPMLIVRCLLLLGLIIDLGLQVHHNVGQILEELGPSLNELLHSLIHLWLLRCPTLTVHWITGVIDACYRDLTALTPVRASGES
jgi:hypothetical protein